MSYDIDDIDQYGAVKPGLGLMLATLFSMRQILYAPISLLARRKSRASSGANIDMSFVEIYSVWELVACVPALAILVALLMRKPTAGPAIRWLNTNARTLLLASALTQAGVLLYILLTQAVQNTFFIVTLVISLYILIYLFRSQRLVDVARDFPRDASG